MLVLVVTALAATPPPPTALQALVLEFRQDGESAPAERIAGLHVEACAAGWAPSCTPEAWRRSGRADLSAARAAFAPLCAAGDPLGCVVEGWTWTQLPSTPGDVTHLAPDLDLGEARFGAACDAGYPRGCSELASVLSKRMGGDLARAWELARGACTAQVANACQVAANIVGPSLLLVPDPRQTERELRVRACELGNMASCAALADMRRRGVEGPADPDGGLAELRRLCDEGVTRACSDASFALVEAGAKTEGRAMRARGCEWGDEDACALLAVGTMKGTGVPADPAAGLAELERLCGEGNGSACRRFGYVLRDGELADVDQRRATAAFEAGCALGDENACDAAGYRRLFGLAGPRDPDGGLAMLLKACAEDLAAACYDAGYALANGMVVARDVAAARTLLEEACARSHAEACVRLGTLLEAEPAEARRAYAKARDLWRTSCDRGVARSCEELADMVKNGQGGRKSARGARRILKEACESDPRTCARLAHFLSAKGRIGQAVAADQRGCEAGVDAACLHLELRQLVGKGVPKDSAVALPKLERRCAEGDGEVCAILGNAYAEGRLGSLKDHHAARRFWARACARGNQPSCRALAAAMVAGQGGPADPSGARRLLERGCDDAVGRSCLDLARRLRKGELGAPPDPAGALVRYAEACARGWSEGCKMEAEMRAAGEGAAADPALAKVLRRRACDLGDKAICGD